MPAQNTFCIKFPTIFTTSLLGSRHWDWRELMIIVCLVWHSKTRGKQQVSIPDIRTAGPLYNNRSDLWMNSLSKIDCSYTGTDTHAAIVQHFWMGLTGLCCHSMTEAIREQVLQKLISVSNCVCFTCTDTFCY